MLSEEEVHERVKYCYYVYIQLTSLMKNELLNPSQYMDYLKNSSLQLGDDEFIKATIEEGILAGREDGGLNNLINLYEGFTHAFCQVLEVDVGDIIESLSPDFLEQLAREMNIGSKR